MVESAYKPLEPARAPGGKPQVAPGYRVLVHRKYSNHWAEIVDRVGIQQAQQFWAHVTTTPGVKSPIASITILKGTVGRPKADGWSRTYHYELSGAARINYQFHNHFTGGTEGDPHKVVALLTIDFGSH